MCGRSKRFCTIFRVVLHAAVAGHFWFATYYDYTSFDRDANEKLGFGGRMKYFSLWDLILQSIFYTVCLCNDLFGSNELDPIPKSRIRQFKDFFQASLSFPFAMFVGITFWTLYVVYKDGVIGPDSIIPNYPDWMVHIVHTNIMVFALLELLVSYTRYPSRWLGILGTTVFMLLYIAWMIVMNYYDKNWVYPGLNGLNLIQIILVFFLCVVAVILLYLIGEFFNYLATGRQLKRRRLRYAEAKVQRSEDLTSTL